MAAPQNKNFNLPWNQFEHYWIHVGTGGDLPVSLIQALKTAGMQVSGNAMAMQTPRRWKPAWDAIRTQLLGAKLLDKVKVSVVPGDAPPTAAMLDWRSPPSLQTIADSLWLGE